jgi:hypothetical protein
MGAATFHYKGFPMTLFVDKHHVEQDVLRSLSSQFAEVATFTCEKDGEPCVGRVLVGELQDEEEWEQTSGGVWTRELDDWVETEEPPKPATPEEAKQYLRLFFEGLSMHYGGPIPETELLQDRHVDMVLRLDLSDCIDIFYVSLAEHGVKEARRQIELFFKLQKRAFRLAIPRHRSGGLLLVWLYLRRGWDV